MRFPRPLTTLTATLLAAVGLAGCNSAPQRPTQQVTGDYSYAIDYLTWHIQREMAEHDIVGLSIALVDQERIVWARGFGLADRERNIAADAHSRYRVGSLSKPLVATAALNEQRLDLDAPIGDYLPGFHIGSRFDDRPPITPRLLLTHHGGLPMDRIAGMWSDQPHFITDLPAQLADEELAAAPGSAFGYSNLGYSLTGLALQTISGQSFESYVKQQVLEPAGMKEAAFSAYAPSGDKAAKAYDAEKDGAQHGFALRDVPAGGLNASVTDLAQYARALLNGSGPLSLAQVEEMWRVQNAGVALDGELEVGLGWFRSQLPGAGLLVHHGGATLYHRAYLGLLPESGLAVVLLSNTRQAIGTVLKTGRKALELAWEAKTGRRLPDTDTPRPMPAGYHYALDDFVGHFDTELGFAKVRQDGNKLAVDLNGQALTLKPLGEGRFRMQGHILGLIPADLDEVTLAVQQVDGRKLLLSSEDGGPFHVIGEALQPIPIAPAWRARVGEYRIINPEGVVRQWAKNSRIQVRMDDGFLLAQAEGKDGVELTLVLQPVGEDRAVVRGIGSNRGQVLKIVPAGDGERVLYSGLSLQKR